MVENKVIHYIWYQGIENVPEKFQKNIKLMQDYNQDWSMRMWNSKQLYELACKYSPILEQIFYKLPHMHQRIDLGRYLILYYHGGLSMDTDVYPLKSLNVLDIWNQDKLVIGEINMNKFEKIILTETLTCNALNNAIIYSRKKYHVVLKLILDSMIKTCNSNLDMTDTDDILWTTGPMIFSQILCNDSVKNYIKILPSEIFEPNTTVLNVNGITDNSVLVHEHEQSWVKMSKTKEVILNIYIGCRKHGFYLLLFIITIIVFSCLIKRNRRK